MRDDDYSHEVERVPGMSDKPPAYESLTFTSPPPKYDTVIRMNAISKEATEKCFL